MAKDTLDFKVKVDYKAALDALYLEKEYLEKKLELIKETIANIKVHQYNLDKKVELCKADLNFT